MSIFLNQLGIVNGLGRGCGAVCDAMLAGDRRGLSERMTLVRGAEVPVGAVTGDLPAIDARHRDRDSRNNRLLLAALEEIREAVETVIARHGSERVAVVLGSSTSGILEGEAAVAAHYREGRIPQDFHYLQQEVGSPSEFLARELQLTGPSLTLSTACTSSAKAMISAARLIQAGLCDAALAGGVDSLCRLTINGFDALESMSEGYCNPFSRNRDGINIGEGATLFLMSRDEGPLRLAGWGESSDAHHISAPDPEGVGAEAAMRAALRRAGMGPEAVSYLNAHGTGTMKNDLMESHAVTRVFGKDLPVGSSKGMIGHTLGAAGATEAALCWLSLHTDFGAGRLPPHVWDEVPDTELAPLRLVGPAERLGPERSPVAVSNGCAFGGSNAVLVIAA